MVLLIHNNKVKVYFESSSLTELQWVHYPSQWSELSSHQGKTPGSRIGDSILGDIVSSLLTDPFFYF